MRPPTGPLIIVWTLSNDSGHKHPTSYSIELLGWTEPWLPKNVQINAWRNGHFSSACILFHSLQLLSRTTTECLPSSVCCFSQHPCNLAEEWCYLPLADQELSLGPWALAPYPISSHCLLSAPPQWSAQLWGEKKNTTHFTCQAFLKATLRRPSTLVLPAGLVLLLVDALKLNVS